MLQSLQPGDEPVPGYPIVRSLPGGYLGQAWEARAPGGIPVALLLFGRDAVPLDAPWLQQRRPAPHPHLLDLHWVVYVKQAVVVCVPLWEQTFADRCWQCREQGLAGIPRDELLRYLTQAAGALDYLTEAPAPGPVVPYSPATPETLLLAGGAVRVPDPVLIAADTRKYLENPYCSPPAHRIACVPPEALRDDRVPQAPLYGLAVVYCEMLCGCAPFGKRFPELFLNILQNEPDLRDLPSMDRPAVARALAKDSVARWPSCTAFVDALRGAAVAPRARALQDLAGDVRHKTLQTLQATAVPELTWAPPGTRNHVLWHAGHALWVTDTLCLKPVTGRSELPPGYADLFRMGSHPDRPPRAWPGRGELCRHLEAQLPRLRDVIGSAGDADLDRPPPHAHPGDERTLGQCILHGLHDEANHQGEMYLLLKMQRLNRAAGR